MKIRTHNLGAISLILLMLCYAIVDSLSIRYLVGQRSIYGFLVITSCLLILYSLLSLKLNYRQAIFLGAWLLIDCLYLLPTIITQTHIVAKYMIGDFTSLLFPLLILIVGLKRPILFKTRPSIYIICFFLVVAIFVSYYFCQRVNNRFEPPHTLLIPIGWIAFLANRHIYSKTLIFTLLISLFILNYYSGERTGLILWVLSAVYTFCLILKPTKMLFCILLLSLLIFPYNFSGLQERLTDRYLIESRFKSIVSGKIDASILSRINESRDALHTMVEKESLFTYIFGFGHGSLYYRDLSNIERNIIKDDLVHHIHFSPVLILFRYGGLGLFLYLLLWVTLIFRHIKFFFYKRYRSDKYADLLFTFSVTLYLINGLLRNVFVDPFFSYTLAGFIYYRIKS